MCFNWAPRHEGVLGEWRYSSTHSLTLALDRGEWSASRPGRFTPRERALGTPSHIKNLKIEIYRTLILSVVLYGFKAWSVSHFEGGTQTEGFENSVLRRKFGPRRYEDGSWRRLHNDELSSLYSSLNIVRVIRSRMMRWVGHVAWIQEGRERERCLWGFGWEAWRRRWEDNMKMDLREIGIDGVNWIVPAQDRMQWQAFVNMVMNPWVPQRKQDIFW